MKITNVRIFKVEGEGKLRGYVSVTLDNCFVVHDIKVIEGGERFFIAMPTKKMSDGTFRDIAHPISSVFRALLENEILKAYREIEEDDLSTNA